MVLEEIASRAGARGDGDDRGERRRGEVAAGPQRLDRFVQT
jgi:hypothetical protein